MTGRTTIHRRVLVAFTLGILAGVAAWFGPWIYFKVQIPHLEYVLTYNRNTSGYVWNTNVRNDPGPKNLKITDYLVKIGITCKIPAWRIGGNEGFATDTDWSGWMHFDVDDIDTKTFNCISKFVIPPYVTLRKQPRLSDGALSLKRVGSR